MEPASPVITAYTLPGAPADVNRLIRPARPRRDWMDRTPESYAYRCIPLSAANSMGWEILNPVNCEFRWNGLTPHSQVFVYREREDRFAPRSHFGSGVVTWDLPFLFRTPSRYGLVVAGPANHDPAHIAPLDGFIRTDWLPFPFTVNWRITTPDVTIRVDEGQPIARIYPFPLDLLDDTRVELRDLSEDPEFEQRFQNWAAQRQGSYRNREDQSKQLKAGERPDPDLLWSRQYARGADADTAEREHQTVFRCQPVIDRRKG